MFRAPRREPAKDALNGGRGVGALAAASSGLDAAYPELDLERYLDAAARKMVRDVQSMCTFDFFLASRSGGSRSTRRPIPP